MSQNLSTFFSADPSVLMIQSFILVAVTIVVFLVLFALRDILLRTTSFAYQVFCILLVAALPVVGFLLYLLIRPSRTLADRKLERRVSELASMLQKKQQEKKGKN